MQLFKINAFTSRFEETHYYFTMQLKPNMYDLVHWQLQECYSLLRQGEHTAHVHSLRENVHLYSRLNKTPKFDQAMVAGITLVPPSLLDMSVSC